MFFGASAKLTTELSFSFEFMLYNFYDKHNDALSFNVENVISRIMQPQINKKERELVFKSSPMRIFQYSTYL